MSEKEGKYIMQAEEFINIVYNSGYATKKNAKKYHSHDNLFHSFLGLAGISTRDYKPELDIFRPCRK